MAAPAPAPAPAANSCQPPSTFHLYPNRSELLMAEESNKLESESCALWTGQELMIYAQCHFHCRSIQMCRHSRLLQTIGGSKSQLSARTQARRLQLEQTNSISLSLCQWKLESEMLVAVQRGPPVRISPLN